jgi:membrane protein DedA with SNARE-associated domain
MKDSIFHFVMHYGYFGIFLALMFGIIGVPIPDEILMIFAGYLIHTHHLLLVPTLLAAFLGSAVGITFSYWLGRGLGGAIINKYGKQLHLTPDRLEKVHRWFERFGSWALVLGYFVPGVRHLTAYTAGMSKLNGRVFAVYAYLGALIWAGTFIAIGIFLGRRWAKMAGIIHHNLLLISICVIGLVLCFILWKKYGKEADPD